MQDTAACILLVYCSALGHRLPVFALRSNKELTLTKTNLNGVEVVLLVYVLVMQESISVWCGCTFAAAQQRVMKKISRVAI